MKTSFCLELISRTDFEALLGRERMSVGACVFEEWRDRRQSLVAFLARYGREDSGIGRDDKGEFLVDCDWYGVRKLSVCFPSATLFSKDVLADLQKFVSLSMPEYLITIVGDYPTNPVMFTILVSSNLAVMAFGPKGRAEYEQLQQTDPDVCGWLNILDGLVS